MQSIRNKARGVTMIETVLLVAILSQIMLSITVFIFQSQKVTGSVRRIQETVQRKNAALQTIVLDLRSACRYSVGSVVVNGGFETTVTTVVPQGWAAAVTGNGGARYSLSLSSQIVTAGFRSMALWSNDGSQVSYRQADTFPLTPGAAYMITASVRNPQAGTNVKLELLNSGNSVVLSSQTGSAGFWQSLKFRYPAAGTYVSETLTGDRAKISLAVLTGAGTAYFDAVSVARLHSVLASTVSAQINIDNSALDMSDFFEPTGFRFARSDDGVFHWFRYRVDNDGKANFLRREKFNTDTSFWEESGQRKLGYGLTTLSLSYDENLALPPYGKETPLVVVLGVTPASANSKERIERTDRVLVGSLTP